MLVLINCLLRCRRPGQATMQSSCRYTRAIKQTAVDISDYITEENCTTIGHYLQPRLSLQPKIQQEPPSSLRAGKEEP